MTKEQYEKWSAPYRKSKCRMRILVGIDKILALMIFISYPVLLAYLICTNHISDLYRCILVPGVSFVVVSLFRRIYSAPRPYEQLDIQPLIHKDTVGKSFPSRHVFSIFLIGMTFFYIERPIGIFIGILGIVMAYARVIGGVHYPKDVAAGAAMGILCGLCFYI